MKTQAVIRFVTTREEFELAYAVRIAVFVQEQSVPEEEEHDAYDELAIHVLALEGDRAIGTGRIVEVSKGVGKIGRIAVLREARRSGIGTLVMDALMRRAEELDLLDLVLDAQLQAIPFYEKLGFVAEGDVFLEAGISHRRMRRVDLRRPPPEPDAPQTS